jgi:hypothetical protein
VIGLGLRLTFSGGREAVIRLVVLAAAVGIGVGLLLTAVSAVNAVGAQNERYAWLDTGAADLARTPPAGTHGSAGAPRGTGGGALAPPGAAAHGDPLWGLITGDQFEGRQIDRADIAATGPTSPVPPGILSDPGPGQYYASPALSALLHSTPADELADRYPGHQVGPTSSRSRPGCLRRPWWWPGWRCGG